jgi:hypothetical protein
MAAADRAWMYKQLRDWDNFVNRVNGFVAQVEADMRNCGVYAMFVMIFSAFYLPRTIYARLKICVKSVFSLLC